MSCCTPSPGWGVWCILYLVFCTWYFVLLKHLITLARTLISSCEKGRASAKKCKLGWQVKVSRNLVNYRLKPNPGLPAVPPFHYPFLSFPAEGYMLLSSSVGAREWGGEKGLLNYVHITSLELYGLPAGWDGEGRSVMPASLSMSSGLLISI